MEMGLRHADGFSFTDTSARSRQFCLCGGKSESTKFYIEPTTIGEIDLTATVRGLAFSFGNVRYLNAPFTILIASFYYESIVSFMSTDICNSDFACAGGGYR